MLESENSDLENSLKENEYLSFMEKNLLEKKLENKINFQNKIIFKIIIFLLFLGILIFLLNFFKILK